MLLAYRARFFFTAFILHASYFALFSQSIDIGAIGKGKAFKISGGVTASGIYYHSEDNSSREPFTYFLQGNLNLGFYQFSLPISYSYSNQGGQLSYNLPYDFNRLSLHPRYKWITGHVGDVSMTFSPYTLNAHQFTGGGIELSPPIRVKFSAMGGRLLKAVPEDGVAQTVPSFQRMGYGAKLEYNQTKYGINVIGFYAKDDVASIPEIPEEKGVLPKENLVISFGGRLLILEDLQLEAEYASTAITQDLRAASVEDPRANVTSLIFNNTAATEYYNALKASLSYSFAKYSLGVAYERVDPGYETLGAYFFNNDFENITLNGTSLLFKDKVNLSFNVGYQQDDLNNQKESATNRTVGSVNVNINATERLNITSSYSNFSTFTNVKLDQFEIINDNDPIDDITDALNYTQLSQNANLMINYVIAQEKALQQTVSFNYALADVSNKQGEQVRIGDASTFHNFNSSYLLGFPQLSLSFTTGLNLTYNTIGTNDATTWGPMLGVNKKFLENKLNSSFSATYSNSENMGTTTNIVNLRILFSYALREKHNFNLNAIELIRDSDTTHAQELTVNFGYSYSF